MRKSVKIFLALFVSLIISSCTQKPIFEETIYFPKQGWNRFGTLEFEFEIKKPDKSYDIILKTHLTEEFESTTLPLYYSIDYPNGELRSSSQFIKVKNRDETFVNPYSDGSYIYEIKLQENKKFNEAGVYKYTLSHGLNKFDAAGIFDMNFKVLVHKEQK